ncbi:ABC2 homolog 6 [Actinidia rufa]|uniref:ABC2 homolog 6 n=1 Tax=Actinidia rufa TaxID=165716 RepID=A0A7J0GMN7_9ERIC|nr:ABC2 homolog 6 [Actinidia rufa]
MADSSHGRASFWTQANALLRKNLTFQKRNIKANIRLTLFPFLLCLLLVAAQRLINSELDKPKNKCGCTCVDSNGNPRSGQCESNERVCGIEYSTLDQVGTCPIPSPPEWPPLLQIPAPIYRAVRTDFASFTDLPDESCRNTRSCPATILLTGSNQSLGERLAGNMFAGSSAFNFSDISYNLADYTLGSDTMTEYSNFLDPAFFSDRPLYHLQPQCSANSTINVTIQIASTAVPEEASCVRGLNLWRNSSSEINDVLYKGYRKGNSERKINEIVAAFDFLNSDFSHFNVNIWYNSTYKNDTGNGPLALMRVPRSVNLASNAYLQFLLGPATKMLFEFVKEMPKPETKVKLDLASLLGPLFFTWVILQLFPVILTSLIYEKQQKLRIMMKMHGLGDGPYWMITYAYNLVISSMYMICFVLFGSLIGLKFFTLNDYSIQFVFYFIYINLQIAMAFLIASIFSNVKTAAVIGYIMVFGTGLLGGFLFQFFLQDASFPRGWIVVMELYPGFSLYRGLYEFSQYAFTGNYMGTDGMRWGDLSDSGNGMTDVLIIMSVEWLVVLFVAYYIDQVVSAGSGVGRSPLFFLQNFRKRPLSSSSFSRPSFGRQGSKVLVQMEKPDVAQEREKVEQLLHEPTANYSIVCDNLKKVYPKRDGNPEKFAVRGMSLALPQGECFGMLGPNGAGKTSFINMMIGLVKPSSGNAYVQGMDIRTKMGEIYTSMGVCPQHDLLWENLTGREHLLFYGRLKNLKGSALVRAVEESLKSVNLFHGGVADKQAGKYSGGMKRRLSVAISLIGDPKVVYMDEPSTGLDPASRNNLWNVVKRAKQNRAIILTTHSMEEAEHLCDRLGIFVDGNLQCIGNPKELKGRYGGSYVFTMTTSSNHEKEVENLVQHLSPNANKIYHLSGTQKFELPKQEVRIADVFQAVEKAKSRFTVHAWGLADTTLEDVFIKVARGAQAFNVLS